MSAAIRTRSALVIAAKALMGLESGRDTRGATMTGATWRASTYPNGTVPNKAACS